MLQTVWPKMKRQHFSVIMSWVSVLANGEILSFGDSDIPLVIWGFSLEPSVQANDTSQSEVVWLNGLRHWIKVPVYMENLHAPGISGHNLGIMAVNLKVIWIKVIQDIKLNCLFCAFWLSLCYSVKLLWQGKISNNISTLANSFCR